MKEVVPLTKEVFEQMNKDYSKCKKNTILRHALSKNYIADVVRSEDKTSDIKFMFNVDIKTLPVCNQKQSGRCWIFAGLNVFREVIAKKCKIKEFELSQSYVAMYDKLEKVNYALESIIDLIDKDYDDRTLQFILQNGVGDGGQFDMLVNVVKKYGLMPKTAFDETSQSSKTYGNNSLLNANIRKFAYEAKEAYEKEGISKVRELQKDLMNKVYALLINCYGKPKDVFDFEYVDEDGKYHIEKGLTPHTFLDKYLGDSLDNYVSIINAPTSDKPFNQAYTIDYLGNVVEGNIIRHLNLPMERVKELIIASLKNGEVVWFGSDVGFYGTRTEGIWDDNLFDYMTPFDLDYKMDKGKALDYRGSAMNHAMVITGVNLDENGKATKWKIENSWGSENGEKGYYVMSSSWFDRYVYQAVVDKKYLSKEELEAYNSDIRILKPWDPMGTLAD